MMQKIDLIIPCYNEEKRLPGSVILDYLDSHADLTVLFVNDGSKDNTAKIIDQLVQQNPSRISSLHLPKNVGKAECVRQGMLKLIDSGQGSWLGFWDADLATPLEELDRMQDSACDSTKMIMATRVRRLGADVQRHAWRHALGRTMATVISSVLAMPVYDSQCGAKLVHRDVASDIFSKPFLSKWLFDCEMLFRFSAIFPNACTDDSLIEVPVLEWKDIPGSKLLFHHLASSVLDIIRIAIHYRLLNKK